MESAINRTIIWQGTWRIISGHLFWGAGLYSFEDMFQHFNNPFVVWPRPHAHNLFLHITSEVGIVGLLFFILFISNVLFSCIKNYKTTENFQSKMLCFFLLIAIAGFFFNNLTEYNWVHPLFQVLFYFLTSMTFVIKRFLNPESKEITFRLTRLFKITVSGLLIMFWVFYVGSPSIGNYYLSKAGKLLLKKDEKAILYLRKASSLDPSNPEPYSILYEIYKNTWLNTKTEPFFENAVHFQKMAIHSFPMQAPLYLDLAKLYEDAKRMDEAEFYYEKSMKIYPNTPEYKYVFALFLARNNKTEKAIAQLENLKVFLEKYEPKGIFLMTVYMNLSEAYKKIHNYELSKIYLDSVVRFPDDIISKEPSDSILKRNFISYKKKATDELTNLMKTNTP